MKNQKKEIRQAVPICCLHKTNSGVILHVRVTPKAAQSKIVGLQDHALKIAVKAPPVDGAANKELIHFLAKALGIPKSQLEIARGESSRNKQVFIWGMQLEEIQTSIKECL